MFSDVGGFAQLHMLRGVTVLRLDNTLIVVEDLPIVRDFFVALGLTIEGETVVEGPWVGAVIGLDDVRADVAVLRTPDGHGRIELTRFHSPEAIRLEPEDPPANSLGIRRVMFAVDDLDDVVERLSPLGGTLVGEVAQFKDIYRLCYLRGPEGIVVGLAEHVTPGTSD
jgi:catechol 2,3-dioxygenase-like lactoylglutathione lyase family enzyme